MLNNLFRIIITFIYTVKSCTFHVCWCRLNNSRGAGAQIADKMSLPSRNMI